MAVTGGAPTVGAGAAGLSVLAGNRLDRLVAHFAETLRGRPLPPLEQEIVVVQSQGMGRWLTLELARRRGIAARLTTPFPRPFIRYLLAQRRPESRRPLSEGIGSADESLFSRDFLLWRLVEILGAGRSARPTLAAPRAYLADDEDQRKLYQLTSRLAALYDEYQLYRGDMLRDWERGDGELEGPATWQAALWRELAATGDAADVPLHAGIDRLVADLRRASERPPWLPRRLSVLGVSSLPPAFIHVLSELAAWLPVTVYLVSPTYHYWADLRSEREAARLERRFAADGLATPFADQHFESGHPLLASLGKQGRELFDLLQRADVQGDAWHELAFVEPEGDGVLASLQRDILHLEAADGDAPARTIDAADRSLTVHVCHSAMREMQVLWGELLRAFDELEDLRPSDVLVLLPDIEKYVPFIRAVFGVDRRGLPRLPFSVADRGAGREQPPSEVILQLLDLASSRVTLDHVFDLLETPAVRRAAGLAPEDTEPLRRLFEEAGVRWGFSGEHRRDLFDVPATDANSWRMGIERVLMGYATGPLDDSVGDALVSGIAPEAGDTAGDAERLGAFVELLTRLEARLRGLAARRSLGAWTEAIGDLLDTFLVADTEDEERGLQLVRGAAADMATVGGRIGATGELSLEVVREHLEAQLRLDGFGSGFLNGQITFCALRPMRTIPFRVVAVAGLDAGIFPRRDRRPGFDLMAREPRPGDRSVRDDDRYLFLETLLATRDRLILSHIGRSQQDGAAREPSAVLSELLEAVDRGFEAPGGGRASDRL
ncbi:MAG: exodeoxyribonuclease V subunit gamma, partial [Acidobacteriota bacterium]